MRELLAEELYRLTRNGLWKIHFDSRVDTDDMRVYKDMIILNPSKRDMAYDIVAEVGFHIDIAPTQCKNCHGHLTYHRQDGEWVHVANSSATCWDHKRKARP